jgi:hypothetical protein
MIALHTKMRVSGVLNINFGIHTFTNQIPRNDLAFDGTLSGLSLAYSYSFNEKIYDMRKFITRNHWEEYGVISENIHRFMNT